MKTFFSKNGLKFGIIVLLLMVSFSLIGCGGSSSKSTPETAGVTFYTDAGYGGTKVTYGVGKYDGDQLKKDKVYEGISSMRIPQGFVVIAHNCTGFVGLPLTCDKDVADLKDKNYDYDDVTRSLEVKYISAQ